ncbi:O-antigen ligase family protein [Photobacterium phosphoreum]|uniref:O-antigen ligase family protein n=1 Tax=Photobacterium phosphoreum TaxID=659 RepID=UPI001E6253DC|nr:O-antigen ligase family protein [Photobacterium phosphoreum]MCD9470819.1 hypothetical protein [Photobacterium phosphoreum]
MIKSNYLTIIFYLFIPFCFIDVINGYFAFHGINIPLSQIYKLIIIISLIPLVINNVLFLFISSALLLSIIYQVVNYTVSFSEDIAVLIRIFIFILAILAFYNARNLLRSNHLELINKIYIVNFIFIFLSVLSGLLGFGLTTYGNHLASEIKYLGFKGFFYAGNELGALLICLLPVVVFSLTKNRYKILTIISFIFISFLIGTKTAILAILILSVVMIVSYVKTKLIFKVVLLITVMILFFCIGYYFSDTLESKFELLSYYYNSRGLSYLILSGRDVMFLDAVNFVNDKFTLFDYFFGVGSSYAASQVKSVEIDFADIMIWNGIFWMFLIYSIFILFSIYVSRLMPKDERLVIKTMFVLILLASMIAGHVLTSAMLLPIISLMLPYGYLKKQFT